MYFPEFSLFRKLSLRCNILTLSKVFENFKYSPGEVAEILKDREYFFILESSRLHPKTGRYSFIGFSPYLIFKSKGLNFELVKLKKEFDIPNFKEKSPWIFLKNLVNYFNSENIETLPPFIGGAVGYIGYEVNRFFENLPQKAIDDLKLPDIFILFFDTVIAFDHFSDRLFIITNVFKEDNNLERLYRYAEEKIKMLEKQLRNLEEKKNPCRVKKTKSLKLQSNMSKEEFMEIVEKAKEYIRDGEIYQANLSQRLMLDFEDSAFALYKILRNTNPSPFASYFNLGDLKIVSCSPERLLKLEKDIVETRPIAGTRPRGGNHQEDSEFSASLVLSEKEKAEHIMLLDMERNDLGRVCEYGTVKVNEMMVIEKYSHVFHIVSNVCGRLRKDKDRFDVIAACFPGGTITGCPKVRCMEIIDELEKNTRGIYCGSIGYLSFNKKMDLNIVIRTGIIKDKKIYIQVGAGIVYDSIPEREYYETLYKAEAILFSIEKLKECKIKNLEIKKFK